LTAHGQPHDGDGHSEALSYDRLEQPWRDWAKIARNFAYQVKEQDREDLMHNIIVRLAEVAEVYRQQGRPLTKWGCIKVAQYTRLRFYHQQKRWRRVFTVSLNSAVRDGNGNETEFIQTLVDQNQLDLDALLNLKDYYQRSSKGTRRAIRKLITESWRNLSGYDWKLIRQFREQFKAVA